MLSRIGHPCVSSNNRVNLDILNHEDGIAQNTSQRYQMWSPAYTVSSVLIQLQALLFEGTAEIALQNLEDLTDYAQEKNKWEGGVRFSVEQSLRYSCTGCKHRPRNYWPTFSEVNPNGPPPPSLDSLYLEEAVCFFTQRPHSEVPLGIGITCSKDLRTGRVHNVNCVPDIISLNAFRGSKVKEAWGVSFSNWFPIYIQSSHPERSLHLAQRSLSTIYAGSPNDFEPSMALDFFPRILCHLTVSFANSDGGGDALRYLHSYCYMHRLFLELISQHQSLVSSAKESLKNFLSDPAKRHVDFTPALGHLVVLLGVTGGTWEELASTYLSESQDRNARRIIKKYPELNISQPDQKIDTQRISKSFSAYNLSGLRFLMMQLVFNRVFVYPVHQYDKHHSLLPKSDEDQLLSERKSIRAVNNFTLFYERIGQKPLSDEEMVTQLRQAIINSQEKRYHGDKGIEVLSPEEFEKQRLGAIRPLQEMVTSDSHLHDDEDQWRTLCETRFCLTELPQSYSASIKSPWKHLYLQHNLQELVSKLNDNPDFKLLYQTLELSKDCLSRFDLVTFSPDNIRSNYYFLSQIIQQLPQLTHLTMSKGEVGLGEKGFRELVKGMARSAGALKVLDMPYLDITDRHVSKLAETQLTSDCLTCLNLEGNNLGTKGSEMLAQLMLKHHSLPNLEQLNLKACRITHEGMTALAEGLLVKRKIKKLDLSKNQCGIGLSSVITNLAYSPSIEELSLTAITLKSGGSTTELSNALEKLFSLTVSLKKVSFWNVTGFSRSFNQSNMKALASNGTIESLDLSQTALMVTDSAPFGSVIVSKNCVLREVDLSNNNLSVSCVKYMVEQAKGRISPVTVLNLSSNKRLFAVLDDKMSKQLVTFFSHTFSKVTHLDLSRCGLSSQSVEVIGQVLSKETALTSLDLSFNSIGKHGARILATGLSNNTTLEVLKLDDNSLGAAGAHYLAGLLEKPSCLLRELHLFCNYVDVPGAVAICKALHTNKHLQYLDLGLNKVRKRGAAALVEMLGVNQTLKTICLKFNYIPDPWAIKIAKQLVESVHCKVSTLKLAGNSLLYETLVTIMTQLNECPREITFDLAGRAEYRDPERMERTVFVSPLSTNITPDMIKKMFYSKKCGAIKSVKIEKHRKRKTTFDKAKYALVEFAHKDSVELAIDLVRKGEARIGSKGQPIISRAGLNSNAAATAAAKSVVREPTNYGWQ
ncbi:uncharacterized protein LOC135333952 isoform X2 [Halichondria panicea]